MNEEFQDDWFIDSKTEECPSVGRLLERELGVDNEGNLQRWNIALDACVCKRLEMMGRVSKRRKGVERENKKILPISSTPSAGWDRGGERQRGAFC